MSTTVDIRVPDVGDFEDIPVIEVLVAEGEQVEQEQSLITLESDKATMEVPAPAAGTIISVAVKVDDRVKEGDLIAVLEVADSEVEESADSDAAPEPSAATTDPEPAPVAITPTESSMDDYDFDVVVLGSGPGGYTAAFRAADLGLRTALVERYPALGGVCLNVGCIPSKALLHTAAVIDQAAGMAEHGVVFGKPRIELDKLREFKDGVVTKLTSGLAGMAKKRKVEVFTGTGTFLSANSISVKAAESTSEVTFRNAIIAAGSESMNLPFIPDDPRIMDSTSALELADIPKRLLVIGGGIIGLEMACVYEALGSEVSVVELLDQLMPGTDKDLVRPLQKRLASRYAGIHLKTRVTAVEAGKSCISVTMENDKETTSADFDRVLVAVGRTANGNNIGADAAGVAVDQHGFIAVNRQMQTNVPNIFAIGDIVGQPMLAHKASHEGKVAAEVCAGQKSGFDARVIPSVAYTDPEVAWVGVTETEAKAQGIDYGVGKFPWAASGRALGNARSEGFTKLLFDPDNNRIIGAGIVGPQAGDLIAECALAIEMGCEAADIGLTIHPHPTLSETIAFAAEIYEGTITDLYIPKKKPR